MSDLNDSIPFIRLYKCPKCSEIFSLNTRFVKVLYAYPEIGDITVTCPECGHQGLI